MAGRRRTMGRVVWALLLTLWAGACGGGGGVNATLEKVSQARQRAADAHLHFSKAANAANRAVMAETDETSVAFAREAEQETQTVQQDTEALRGLLQSLGYADEQRLLDEFVRRFGEYRALDRRILDLAVENTNLKAQRLAFGPAQEAAEAFRDALAAVQPASPRDTWHVAALAATALTTVREIQVLQAPHIANADDAVMTRMEGQMATSAAAARDAIAKLRPLTAPASHARLDGAGTALDRFIDLNAQVIALSRRNTNVRSLALSLDQKRTATAACEESLGALQAALSKRGYTGVR